MAGIYWLASYPKSGNTWLRFLAGNLVFGAVDSAERLGALVPDIHELADSFELPSQPLLVKTHFRYSQLMRFATQTSAAIYLLRDPADVLVSNFHYALRSGAAGGDPREQFNRYFDAFVEARGDPRWVRMGMGTWEDNVRSWQARQREFPVHWIRYEDMLADCSKVATELCMALRITRTAAAVDEAVRRSSFGRLREIEEHDIRERRVGIFYKPYLQAPVDAGFRFMRSGLQGAARREMSEQQWQRFNAAFGELRRECGYH